MNERLIIRLSRTHISFTMVDAGNTGQPVTYAPYDVNNSISMSANLREAFRMEPLLGRSYQRITVMTDSRVLLVPIDLFEEQEKETLYHHSYPTQKHAVIASEVMPSLNCIALFAIDKDVKTVIDDHFPQAQYMCCMTPVWRHLHQRSFTGVRNKLFGYFHDQHLEVFSFQQNRFKFCNTFDAQRMHDSLYFLLYVWKQLNLQQEHDELHLAGNIPHQEELLEELRRYLKRAYVVNPTADFNRSPVTQIAGMPYDLMTMIVKGR